jgi:hypothetical protein
LLKIGAALIADRQAPARIEPGQRARHPPTIAPPTDRALDPVAGNPRLAAALTQRSPTVRRSIPLVRVQFRWPLPGPATGLLDRFYGVHHGREDGIIGAIGPGQANGQRDALPVDQQMALRARRPLGRAAIRRIRAGRGAPFWAGTLALSTLARDQSIRSAAPSWSTSTRCRRCQPPAVVQARRRRQQVTPLPQPSSWGSSSQGMPLVRTKRIPVSTARAGIRGRPPRGLGGSGGKSGAIAAQRSSVPSGLALPPPSSQTRCARMLPGF